MELKARAKDEEYTKISNTRGAPLGDLSALCFILGKWNNETRRLFLVEEAIRREILNFETPSRGTPLPTRINHYMHALRKLGLVSTRDIKGEAYYKLTDAGTRIYQMVKDRYEGYGTVTLQNDIRNAWRHVLADSPYVRYHWLKYFMPNDSFTMTELLSYPRKITIYRFPLDSVSSMKRKADEDSGLRLVSESRGERQLNEIERREIYEGLRRWTNDAYLTDDRVPEEIGSPFLHLLQSNGSDVSRIESHIVRIWLDPACDVDRFEVMVQQVFDAYAPTKRIKIPDLILELCQTYGFSKENVKQLLEELYYSRHDRYQFERGSAFLIQRAFDVAKPEDYYVKIEGVWRTGLARYE